MLFLAFSRYGELKLGPDDSELEFRYLSWIAMLFAAGMGIGLMYFAVGEPMTHFASPPEAEPLTIAAQREAMSVTFFHWGGTPGRYTRSSGCHSPISDTGTISP